jgi:glycine oxidase
MLSNRNIGVVGAGIQGRLVALRLLKDGHQVTLFDKSELNHPDSASNAAAGMLAPYTESLVSHEDLAVDGVASIECLKRIIDEFAIETKIVNSGTIIAAPRGQESLVEEKHSFFKSRGFDDKVTLASQVPLGLGGGLVINDEGYIDSSQLLVELGNKFLSKGGDFKRKEIFSTQDETIFSTCKNTYAGFDNIIDCRGFGANKEIENLRPVRGETVIVKSKNLKLTQTLRVLNGRHSFYVVPRGENNFVIGGVQVESNGPNPTVESLINILSHAYRIHMDLRQAEVLSFSSGIRPSFSDNNPKIIIEGSTIRINGLYRHGFLLAPLLAEKVGLYFKDDEWAGEMDKYLLTNAPDNAALKKVSDEHFC